MLPHTGDELPRRRATRVAKIGILGAATACAALAIQPPAAAAKRRSPQAKSSSEASEPVDDPPSDPDEATPFMAPRYGAARPNGRRYLDPTFAGSDRRFSRLQLTAKPLFASFRVAFVGRPTDFARPTRGGGAGFDVDLTIIRPFKLRFTGGYSGHPVRDAFERNEDGDLVQTAAAGTIHTGHAGVGVAYFLDVGRLRPTIDLGAGLLWVRTPDGIANGQLHQECLGGGVCDLGLTCAPETLTCEPAALPVVHGGLAIDGLLTDRVALGIGLRYFAFLTAPANFPIYLQAAARLGIRF